MGVLNSIYTVFGVAGGNAASLPLTLIVKLGKRYKLDQSMLLIYNAHKKGLFWFGCVPDSEWYFF